MIAPQQRRDAPDDGRRPGGGWSAAITLVLLCVATAIHAEPLRLLAARTAVDTGLVNRLVDVYESEHPDRQVQILPAGNLDVLERARHGIADAVISHAPESEQLFMADGYGSSRTLIMYNQFAIFGPPDDPLELRRQADLLDALKAIAGAKPPFLVQGSRSGTRYRLLQLWAAARIRPDWIGYESTGGGSPSTLSTAAEFGAYAFADLGSYFALPADKRAAIAPLVRDHRALRNDYHYLVVNPDKVPGARRALAEDFLAFLVSDRGQQLIGKFDNGPSQAAAFTPAAHLDRELSMRRSQDRVVAQQRQMYLLGAAVTLAVALSLLAGIVYRRARDLAGRATQRAERLERAVRASREGLYEWDVVAGSLFCTPLMLELLGVPDSDAHSLHALLRQALDHAQASQVSATLQDSLGDAGEGPFRIELRCGGQRLELRGEVRRDANGTPVCIAGSLRELGVEAEAIGSPHGDGLLDPLTGLPARQLLTDRLQYVIRQCARTQQICMVLMVGLNTVRTAGALGDAAPDDAVIKAIAVRLRQLLRASDTIARLDDDNFVILLTASDEQHCRLGVEKLLAGLQRPFHVEQRSVHVDAAIGCALYPQHGQHQHSLLQRAQLAMLQATRDNVPLLFYQAPASPGGSPRGD